jgi:hypothetical protein
VCCCASALSQPTPSTDEQTRHNIGFGVHYVYSDAIFNRVSLLYSTLYSHSIAPDCTIEITSNFCHSSMSLPIIDEKKDYTLTSAIITDASLVLKPVQSIDALRCGIGLALRWNGITRAGIGFDVQTRSDQLFWERYDPWSVGGKMMVEYVLPITTQSDISFRAQGWLFTQPFVGKQPPEYAHRAGYGISAGMVVRFAL